MSNSNENLISNEFDGSITINEHGEVVVENAYLAKLFEDLNQEEVEALTGGASVNFDLNSYLFTIGAGAVFNGGLTTNVVNIAFQKAIYTTGPNGTLCLGCGC